MDFKNIGVFCLLSFFILHCQQKYHDARMGFICWIEAGSVRQGILFDTMKNLRTSIINATKYVKKNR